MSRFLSSIFAVVLLAVSVVPLASAGEAAKGQPAKSSLASKAMTDQEMDQVTAAGTLAIGVSPAILPFLELRFGRFSFESNPSCFAVMAPAIPNMTIGMGCLR